MFYKIITKKNVFSLFLFILISFTNIFTSHADPVKSDPTYATADYPVIQIGMPSKDPAIIKIRSLLKKHNCLVSLPYASNNDQSEFFNDTEINAVNSFRKANGITSESGIGVFTWEALSKNAGEKTASGDPVVDCSSGSTNNSSNNSSSNNSSNNSSSGGENSYANVSSWDGKATTTDFANVKDTGSLGGAFNYILTIMAVVIVVLVIYKVLQGAVIKGTFDNVYDQQKGKKILETAGKALILFIVAYAILTFINPDLTGWTFVQSLAKDTISNASNNNSNNSSGGSVVGAMCGTFVNTGPKYCQDTDAVLPFKDSTVRGLKNNNPGNIIHAKNNWYGICVTQSDTKYVQFKNPESGIRAMAKLLINYNKNNKLNTIQDIINNWAPSSDGNDPNSYSDLVATTMGIKKTDSLPSDFTTNFTKDGPLYKMIIGITTEENGNKNAYDEATILKALGLLSETKDGDAKCFNSSQTNSDSDSLSAKNTQCKNISAITPVKYLGQCDGTWSNITYGKTGVNTTYCEGGCGPTSATMVVDTLLNKNLTPENIGQEIYNNGGRPSGGGTDIKSIGTTLTKVYGLTTKYTNDWNDVKNFLQGQTNDNINKLVIVLFHGTKGSPKTSTDYFTQNGHFEVIWKIENGKVYLNDPYNKKSCQKLTQEVEGVQENIVTSAANGGFILVNK